jgi:hypothetical protein
MSVKRQNCHFMILSNRGAGVGSTGRDQASFSEELVNGTRQRDSIPGHRRQCCDATFLTLVTPGSLLQPFRVDPGGGIPHRAIVSSTAEETPGGLGAWN